MQQKTGQAQEASAIHIIHTRSLLRQNPHHIKKEQALTPIRFLRALKQILIKLRSY